MALAFAIALGLHGLFICFLLLLSQVHFGKPPPSRGNPSSVAMRPISADQWAKNRGQRAPDSAQKTPLAKAQEKKPEEKKAQAKPQGQVVDVAPGNNEEDPEAKYLAESSNKVKKETKAKEQTAFYRNAMPNRTTTTPQEAAGNDNVEKAQVAGNNGVGNDDRPVREAGERKNVFEVPDTKRRDEVAMRTDPFGLGPGANVANKAESAEVQGNSNRLKIQPGTQGGGAEESSAGKKGQAGVLTLVPSMAVLDKIAGAAPNDHLGDVDEGNGTFLNTKEWKFASFFNRVKQSVGMHWDPGTVLRRRDMTGNIYGGRDRYTVLNVTLTERGTVKEIFVEKSSGLDFLDLEAIQSFERAQPFPNPPPGLIASDSTVRFSFGFFLEMGDGARMRLFRQAN
ncbi:MAG: cell envelope integrity protein TolA [Myxococcaceae bacterium]